MIRTAPITNAPAAAASSEDAKRAMLKEIGVKWDKFSEQELAAIKDKDDLVTQVVAKYSTEKANVQRDVDTLLKGRGF